MAARITGTKKDNSGEICEYILDTGETISKAEGVTKAKNGEIGNIKPSSNITSSTKTLSSSDNVVITNSLKFIKFLHFKS